MARRSWVRDLLWMSAGAMLLLALTVVVLVFYKERDPMEQFAFKAKRSELVGHMRVTLATAAEAEKSAVLAASDQESQAYADQARAATATIEKQRQELAELLRNGGTAGERELLDQFSQAFVDFQRIDADLLGLAVKNTNLKAAALAFGPARQVLSAVDAALSRIAARGAESPESAKVLVPAFEARIAALRVHTLLPPHIAEEHDDKMDALEALMTKDEREVRRDLDALATLPGVAESPDLATARSEWDRYADLKTQIIALSRENTNVRSLTLSLNRKRTVTAVCQNTLASLQQAIDEEPIAGVTAGRWALPR